MCAEGGVCAWVLVSIVNTHSHISTQTKTPTTSRTILGLWIGAINRKLRKSTYELMYSTYKGIRVGPQLSVICQIMCAVRQKLDKHTMTLVAWFICCVLGRS